MYKQETGIFHGILAHHGILVHPHALLEKGMRINLMYFTIFFQFYPIFTGFNENIITLKPLDSLSYINNDYK